jgi:hypothetical protein
VTKPVRFEDEADAEYRAGGRWYEERVVGLGMEFFDAVDAVLDQISDWHYFPLPGPTHAEPDCRSPTGVARSSPCARWPPVVFPPNSLPAGSGASGWTSLLECHDVFRGPISVVPCPRSRGNRQVWKFYVVPGPGEPGYETWPKDNDAWNTSTRARNTHGQPLN